jgi:hypothetical protein
LDPFVIGQYQTTFNLFLQVCGVCESGFIAIFEAKQYLLDFTLLGFLSRSTDTGHVGNDFLGVFSLSGTRLATVEDLV